MFWTSMNTPTRWSLCLIIVVGADGPPPLKTRERWAQAQRPSGLRGDLELFGEFGVRLAVLPLEVLEEAAAFADLPHEALPRRKVFLVAQEVARQVLDLGRQDGDLDLRGTG